MSNKPLSATVVSIFCAALACTRASDLMIRYPDGRSETLTLAETLRISWSSNGDIDWQKRDSRIIDNIMEGLVQYDFSGGKIGLKPALASEWNAEDQGRRWIFRLRQDVQWSDGRAFRAQDVVDGWRRVLDRSTASSVAYFLFPIKNAKAFNEGKVAFEKVGIKIRAPDSLEVELESPTAFFPYLLTNGATFPIRLDLIEKFKDRWTEPENLVTLGPYQVALFQAERMIVLKRNASYYDRAAIDAKAPKNVVIYDIANEAGMNLFESGKSDLLQRVPPSQVRFLSERLKPRLQRVKSLELEYMGMTTLKSPTNNSLVRKAIAHAIDRNELIKVLGTEQEPLASWIPKSMLGYNDDIGLQFSPDEAKKLLRQAGYSETKKLPRLELAINNPEKRTLAESIQFQLKKNLDIDVDIRQQEWKTLRQRFAKDPPHLFFHAWDVDFPDPDNLFNLVTSFSGNNHTKWQSKAFDEMILRAAGLLDSAAREKIYREAQKLLIEKEAPVFPMFSSDRFMLVGPRVRAYVFNPIGKVLFKEVRLEQAP